MLKQWKPPWNGWWNIKRMRVSTCLFLKTLVPPPMYLWPHQRQLVLALVLTLTVTMMKYVTGYVRISAATVPMKVVTLVTTTAVVTLATTTTMTVAVIIAATVTVPVQFQ